MSLSKEEIDRINDIKKKLELTYKSTVEVEQRMRLKKDLDELNGILEKIKTGEWVNPVKLKLFSSTSYIRNTPENDDDINCNTKYENIDIIKICDKSRDHEMNTLYSYFVYFENNFYPVLSIQNLKLRFDTGKRRDDFLVNYDMLLRQINNYKKDIDSTNSIKDEKQRINYEERLNIEKYQIIYKMDEFFRKLLKLIQEMNTGIASGEKIVLNPDEKYYDQHNMTNYAGLEGKKIMFVLIELEEFIKVMTTKIQIPDFMKGKRNE